MAQLMAFDRLEDVTGGDDELAGEIVSLFADTTASYLERLNDALIRDSQDWSDAAHALKGCCLNFGAAALAETAKACEHEAPCQNRIAELTKLYDETCKLLSTRYQLTNA